MPLLSELHQFLLTDISDLETLCTYVRFDESSGNRNIQVFCLLSLIWWYVQNRINPVIMMFLITELVAMDFKADSL